MRQNRTVRASSVWARRGVWLGWAICCSLVRGDYDGPLSTLNPRNTHLGFARNTGEITWGESAREIWESVYEELSEGETGLFGAATSRAEAQVLRLSAIYAVMDKSRTIEADHLLAGLAVWEYAEQSARRIFGDASGDPVADKIMEALRNKPEGLTRNEIRDLFARHRSSARIDQALNHL